MYNNRRGIQIPWFRFIQRQNGMQFVHLSNQTLFGIESDRNLAMASSYCTTL